MNYNISYLYGFDSQLCKWFGRKQIKAANGINNLQTFFTKDIFVTEFFATCHCFIFNLTFEGGLVCQHLFVKRMSYFSGHPLTLAYKYTLVNPDRGSGLRARSVANTDMFQTRHRPRSASGTQCQRTFHSASKHTPMQSPLLSFL